MTISTAHQSKQYMKKTIFNQHLLVRSRRRNRALTGFVLATFLVALPGCISASAPKTAASLNGEAMYEPQPWVNSKPVNITGRLNAIQGALSAAGAAHASFVEYKIAQADEYNQRQERKRALESQRYHARLRAEEEERQRQLALSHQYRQSKPGAFEITLENFPDSFNHEGWELGVQLAGWIGMQDAQLRQLRVDTNTNMRSSPPPKPPRPRPGPKHKKD